LKALQRSFSSQFFILCLNKATLDNRSVVIVLISQHYVYDSIVLTNISARNTIMYL